MKNLNPYAKVCIDAYEFAISRKQDQALKDRLAPILASIKIEYTAFEKEFRSNSMESIQENTVLITHKADLQCLYEYGRTAIIAIREDIEGLQPNSIKYTCQYCSINAHDSMDHYLPDSRYFCHSVNPLNLVPCCTTCNRQKSSVWMVNGQRVFINFYTDILPTEEFLFARVFLDATGSIDFEYDVLNVNSIDASLFQRISDHFDRLDLKSRMRKAGIGTLSEFQLSVEKSLRSNSFKSVFDSVVETAIDFRNGYGANHWKPALEIALIKSPVFISTLSHHC